MQGLNALITDVDVNLPALLVKEHDASAFERVLRALARRCQEPLAQERLRAALLQWTSNGGKLPECMSLVDSGVTLNDDETDQPYVPNHRVLLVSFRLQSSAFMLTYNSRNIVGSTWQSFRDFIERLAKKLGAKAWAACLEASEHAVQQRHHTHAYLLWTDGVGCRQRNLDAFSFEGVRPRVDVCRGPGSAQNMGAPRRAALRGFWYVSVFKAGTVASDASWKCWVDYKPDPSWLTGLWDAHKLSTEDFVAMSAKFRTGHSKRKHDALEVERDERVRAVAEHVAKELNAVERNSPLQAFRVFPQVEEFIDSFLTPERRKPILVIVGGTNSGKSLLAASVLNRIAEKLGLQSFVEVTVEGDKDLDFSNYDHRKHGGDAMTLWKCRETLQGRPKVLIGGRSGTMMYAYKYTLARRGIVATMDLSALNLAKLHTNHWLNNPRNIVLLELAGSVFVDLGPAVAPEVRSHRDLMSGWSVEDTRAFYEARDAAGIASNLAANSVNGADLLSFRDPGDLVADLRFTPFAAKKALQLRGDFLREA